MTEQKKWRVEPCEAGIEPGLSIPDGFDIYEEGESPRFHAGWFAREADAARIVALNNADGEPAAWHVRYVFGDGTATAWEDYSKADADRLLRNSNIEVRPLYAAPVVPEPPAAIDLQMTLAEVQAIGRTIDHSPNDIVDLVADWLAMRAALARCPARPATPVIDERLVMRDQGAPREHLIRTIIAEHDAVIQWAEGRKTS